jgi:hypothetical protein
MSGQHRPYEELRAPIEQRGGSMVHVREGHQWGAWVITLDGKTGTFLSNGRGYPDLDRLYRPKVSDPQHYTDYSNDLVPGAIEKLISLLK